MSMTRWVHRKTVHDHITALPGVRPVDAWGETSYFFNPGRVLKRGTYFATIKDHDGENDNASDLNRPNLWRLNMGISKASYVERFGPPPPRPGKGGVIEGSWDFKSIDQLMPHPVYGWMSWVAVLTPSNELWSQDCVSLLHDAYDRAQHTFDKRTR